MEDICNFLPKKTQPGSIELYHFVYEASFKKLRQPFFAVKYQIYLTFKGRGVLILDGAEHMLVPERCFSFSPPRASVWRAPPISLICTSPSTVPVPFRC